MLKKSISRLKAIQIWRWQFTVIFALLGCQSIQKQNCRDIDLVIYNNIGEAIENVSLEFKDHRKLELGYLEAGQSVSCFLKSFKNGSAFEIKWFASSEQKNNLNLKLNENMQVIILTLTTSGIEIKQWSKKEYLRLILKSAYRVYEK